MRWISGTFAIFMISLQASSASAQQPGSWGGPAAQQKISQRERQSLSALAHRAPLQPRVVHPDYSALSAGVLVFGLGYALAVASPLRGGPARLAIPIAGPWLSDVSWAWALDGLVQIGGVAFMVDAFANPVTVLGTPESHLIAPQRGEHVVKLTFDL